MRQITQDACTSFETNTPFTRSNTSVVVDTETGTTQMILHGHTIARNTLKTGLEITNAGWASNVTKERLNGLNGVSIYQKNWQWYLNDEEWDGKWTKIER